MVAVQRIPPMYARDANALRSAAPALIFVGVSWCGYCKHAWPILENVALTLGSTVPVYYVDAEKQKDLAASLGVKSYPTLLYVNNNGIKKFQGDRTVDTITGFVCANSAHGTVHGFCTAAPKKK